MRDPAPKSTPHNSGANADPEATFDSAATPEGFDVPDLGSIGPYRLTKKLGEGGMGQVWLAEQSAPVKRQVALKLIKGELYDNVVIQRFESERQSLAAMNHPAIAKVFDAGSAKDGQPYFVMEYVDGLPITRYCDSKKLKVQARLELFIKVCEGVQHAHQKAIIHRDLKPSNVLVVEVDGKPVPRIIDFGLAKAVSPHPGAEQTQFTQMGVLVGTRGFMSPEQADPNVFDVDTRTDVYSLGVVLYVLLTGMLPFDSDGVKKKPIDEVLRQLREEDPPSPSTKINTEKETATVAAEMRGMETKQLVKLLCGDLDWITLKALEKDPARRYGTPSELAADINRYLQNEPVTARPASAAYRVQKYVQRHKALVVGTAAVFAVLVAGVITSTWQAVRARTAERLAVEQRDLAVAEKKRADTEAAVAQAINDFLQNDVLAQASAAAQSGPRNNPDPDLKVRTALDRAAARIKGKFDRQPEVEAAIRDTIGQTYMGLGIYPEARTQFEGALELQRRVLESENPKTLKTMSRLGRVLYLQGAYPRAEALLSQTLEVQRRVLGPEHPDTLSSMNNLGGVYYAQGKYALAEALQSRTLEIQRRVLGSEHPDTLRSMVSMASAYHMQGKYAQAQALLAETLEIQRHVLGPEHPNTLYSMSNLAAAYYSEGKYAQAAALLAQTLEIQRRVLGSEHPDTLRSMNFLASAYYSEGKYAQAAVLYSQTMEIQRRVSGPEHPDTLITMNNLASAYYMQSKYAQAQALLAQALEIIRRVLGPEHPVTLSFLANFVSLYQRQGDYAMAGTLAAQVLAQRRHALGSEQSDTMASAADLALVYYSQGKFAASESLAREALEFDRKKQPEDWQRFRAESLLGASLARQKKYAEAEPLLLEGYQGMVARKDRIDVPERYHLDRAREWTVQLYQAWGKPEKAAKWGGRSQMPIPH